MTRTLGPVGSAVGSVLGMPSAVGLELGERLGLLRDDAVSWLGSAGDEDRGVALARLDGLLVRAAELYALAGSLDGSLLDAGVVPVFDGEVLVADSAGVGQPTTQVNMLLTSTPERVDGRAFAPPPRLTVTLPTSNVTADVLTSVWWMFDSIPVDQRSRWRVTVTGRLYRGAQSYVEH